MEYRNLGSSGLQVSAVSLGTWLTVGTTVDQDTADTLVRTAFERGVNLFDTADVYNLGEAELALGKAIAGMPRDRLVIATKCFFPMSEDVNDRGLSRKHVVQSLHGSLRRLGLDYVDLYQCHRPDPHTPLAETCRAMDDLIRQGKALYWGVSAWPGHAVARAVDLCARHGWHPPVSNQPRYNLLDRHIEAEVLPACAEVGVGQIVYSPLAQGVLSAKYRPGELPAADTRAADDRANRFITQFLGTRSLQRVEQFARTTAGWGATPARIALAWCLRRPEVSSVIVGARTAAQLEENVAAVAFEWEPGMEAELDRLFPPPGDGLTP